SLNLQFAEVTFTPTEEEKKYIALLNQSISNITWSPQTRSFLDRNNIKVWGDLTNLNEAVISKMPGANAKIVNEIKQRLLQQGLMFRS
ncbi:MAG: DNA-directed RNA polymerase subunit alpha C-terminal domain-containing protein, partial [Planctomycetota bacterium]